MIRMSKPRLPEDWVLEEFHGNLDGYGYAKYSNGYDTVVVEPVAEPDQSAPDYHRVKRCNPNMAVWKKVDGTPDDTRLFVHASNIARTLIVSLSNPEWG